MFSTRDVEMVSRAEKIEEQFTWGSIYLHRGAHMHPWLVGYTAARDKKRVLQHAATKFKRKGIEKCNVLEASVARKIIESDVESGRVLENTESLNVFRILCQGS